MVVSDINQHVAEHYAKAGIGSHWSLLFRDLKNKSISLFDTIKLLNSKPAQHSVIGILLRLHALRKNVVLNVGLMFSSMQN